MTSIESQEVRRSLQKGNCCLHGYRGSPLHNLDQRMNRGLSALRDSQLAWAMAQRVDRHFKTLTEASKQSRHQRMLGVLHEVGRADILADMQDYIAPNMEV